ncbi:MAG TPA: ATP-binding protein [Streptosporangiaceae bacterium]|nr:ATP-binding protein [Streptosporangiaceae bacterium]
MLPGADPTTPPAMLTATRAIRAATWSQTFPATPDQVRITRQGMAAFLGGWPLTTDAVTCLSELVTNAIEHSRSGRPGGHITVQATLTAAHLDVAVQDQGGPWQQEHNQDGLRGRGLHIVAALTDCWGRTDDSTGTRTVWFHLTCHCAQEETTMPATSPDANTLQAIADDYPGWDISHDGHWWSATSPAVSVQADTPDGLRSALERIIGLGQGSA